MKNRILLITKLVTTNIGNQALSDEVIRLYEDIPDQFMVAGRPEGLFGYSIEKLQQSGNAVQLFESWVDNLVSRLKHFQGITPFTPKSKRVELLSFDDFKVKNDRIFQRVKDIFRKYIHSDYLFAKAYKN